jgi:hypothetical protein
MDTTIDERFKEWIGELLSNNNLHKVEELTPEIIITEIRDTESSIASEEYWANGSEGARAAMHRNNAVNLRDYIVYLEGLIPNMHTLELILSMYEDPDELPKLVKFLVPETMDTSGLKKAIVTVRDKVMSKNPDLCGEEAFERVLYETCMVISRYCHWRYEPLTRLHGKENLWAM